MTRPLLVVSLLVVTCYLGLGEASLLRLAEMVNTATGKHCFSERLWQDYGCYCGLGSRCQNPVGGTLF